MYTLTDLLNGASDHRLVQLTSRHGIAGQALTRDQMITGLEARLGNPSYLQTVIRDLPASLQLALRRHLIHGRSIRNTADQVLGNRVAELSDALRTLGLLGPGTMIPLEVERAAIRLWAKEMVWTGQVSLAGAGPDPTGPGALRDLFALLSMAARRGLPLTQQGDLFRKAEEQYLKSAEDCRQLSPGVMPLLVIDYAQGRGLIAPGAYDETAAKPKRGLLPTALAETWAQQSWAAIWTDMTDHLLEAFRSRFGGIRPLLQILVGAPAGSCFKLRALKAEFDRLSGKSDWPPADGNALDLFIKLLAGLDLVHLKQTPDGELLAEATPALVSMVSGGLPEVPKPESQFVLQPTFEIVAPKTLPPSILYRLERLAGDRRADGVLQYRLSFDSLRPALESGKEAGRIVAFFEQHSKPPVAPNVLAELREWTARGVRARFESAILLRLNDPEIGTRLMGDRALRGMILSALTPTDLIVTASAVEKIRRRLGEMAVVTAPGIGEPGTPAPRNEPSLPSRPGPKSRSLSSPASLVKRWFDGPLLEDRSR